MNSFKNYLFTKDYSKNILKILLFFTLFYILCNVQFINLIVFNELKPGPFDYSPININIFNMDPSQMGGLPGTNFLHPLFTFITLLFLPIKLNNYLLFLVLGIEALIGSLSVVLVYIYLSNLNISKKFVYVLTAFFGFFSYGLASTLIPDSYVIAQFIILLSLVYIQYSINEDKFSILGFGILGTLNFGVTITNIIPFAFNTILAGVKKDLKSRIIQIFKAICVGLGIIIILTSIQFAITKTTWFKNGKASVEYQSSAYAVPYKPGMVPSVVDGFVASPIMTGPLTFKEDLMAVVTDLSTKFPIQHKVIIGIVLLLCIASIILNIKKKDTWFLLSIIGFAIFLHLLVGFGLGTYYYDVYLYAGNYICTIPLLIGLLCTKLKEKNPTINKVLFSVLCVITVVILLNNLYMHTKMYELIKLNYLL